MGEKLYAPEVDEYIRILNSNTLNPKNYDGTVNRKLNVLYGLLDKIQSMGNDDLKILYFPVARGDISHYGDYEKLKSLGFVSNYKEFEDDFNRDYSEHIYWYRLAAIKYKCFRTIDINFNVVICADISDEGSCFFNSDLLTFIDFLICKVRWCLSLLKDNKYNDYVNDNLPYKNRFGVIKREDYWSVYPEIRNNLLEKISIGEIERFVLSETDKCGRVSKMTSGDYFSWCKVAYRSIGYDVCGSDKDVYLKYSDGRDEGLSEINQDSSLEFDRWYDDEDRFGGHPYEIIAGHSFSRVSLYIEKDDGYCLGLNGNNIFKNELIAKIYLALRECVPVRIYNGDVVKKSLTGSDYLGVVPNWMFLMGNSSYFKDYWPLEFIYLNDDIFKYVKWQEVEKAYLK